MKKAYTKILIISIVSAIIIALICSLSMNSYLTTVSQQKRIESENTMTYGMEGLVEIGTAMLTAFAEGFVAVSLLFGIYAILIIEIILQTISRSVQIGQESKTKDKASKAITIIAISLKGLLCLALVFAMLIVNKVILSILLLLVAVVISIISIIETTKLLKTKPE